MTYYGNSSDDLMNNIIDNIYIGNIESGTNHELLKKHNIIAIVNLSNSKNNYPKDIQIMNIMIDDAYNIDITSYLEDAYNFIEKYNKDGNVLVHCRAGISRSSSVVIHYIMKKYNKSYQEALSFVKEKRSIVQPNDGFMRQLVKYQIDILGINMGSI